MYNPGGPGPQETRNMIIAIVLSAAIFLGFQFFYEAPRARQQAQERAHAEQVLREQQAAQSAQVGAPAVSAPAANTTAPREQVLSAQADQRIVIDTPVVDGSILLEGARIDDLNLRRYRRTVDRNSPEVTLLAPAGSNYGHDAFFGWEVQQGDNGAALADATSHWTAAAGQRLTPQTPITLTLQAGGGRTVERTIAIDANYMFTITDVVRNASATPLTVRPFGTVRRQGLPEGYRFLSIVHQGMIGAFGPDNHLQLDSFRNADKHARERARGRVGDEQRMRDLQGTGGWFGITDHYWLTAIIPDQGERVSTYFDARNRGAANDYLAAYRGAWRQVPAGGSVTYTQRVFAGAKRFELLQTYQRDLHIPRFDDAIDWGNFWFLTRPFFGWLLHPLAQWFAGMGISINLALAILCSTIVIKALTFPLVYQSYKSMARMRAMLPKQKEIQERYAADKQRQQQEILKLYQTEKVNPVAGCIPQLLTIPVFFALYKTLSVTIEMRHAPFVGWIRDLSAPDPTSLFNLFGLLPYNPHDIPLIGGILPVIGVWPILYGVSMLALQSLSPPPTDQTQAQIFRLMPIMFTFLFASFPAGLVIYWTWSNTVTMLQQYVIMRRQGTETQLDKFLAKRFNKQAPAE